MRHASMGYLFGNLESIVRAVWPLCPQQVVRHISESGRKSSLSLNMFIGECTGVQHCHLRSLPVAYCLPSPYFTGPRLSVILSVDGQYIIPAITLVTSPRLGGESHTAGLLHLWMLQRRGGRRCVSGLYAPHPKYSVPFTV